MPSKTTNDSIGEDRPDRNSNADPEAKAGEPSQRGNEVLDLIDPPKKTRVRKKAAKKAAAKQETSDKEAEPGEPEKSTLAEQRASALDLIEDEEKPAAKKSKKAAAVKEGSLFTPLGDRSAKRGVVTPSSKAEEEEEKAEETPEDEEGHEEEEDARIIHLKPPIIVKELADRMQLKPHKLIKELMELDVFVSPTHAIEPDIAAKICESHGYIFEKEKREKGAGVHKVQEIIEEPPAPTEEEQAPDELKLRAPIITFMGHVDHGKTSLLDAIRKSRVTSGEAGGITQHLGAYSVPVGDKHITFIDTPGHAAFSEMRARGANVTDIVVLVVAADDGFMPQTIEALNHAKAAGVTIMVAINKCDLPSADPDRVRRQMQENGLSPEAWGGDTIAIEVSAQTGQGLDDLLDMMSLQAEVLELVANPDATARAIVIESSMQPGKGPTATTIVEMGTLTIGMPFICGPFSGKVKSLIDDRGKILKEAGPAMPVEVLGFSGLPNVGDELVEMDSERSAKKLSEERQVELRKDKLSAPKKSTLEHLLSSAGEGEKKVLKLVLKTDVQGSLEAIKGSLNDIESEKVNLEFLHAACGAISESDVLLASASDAIIIGFNVKVEGKAVKVAKRENIQVKLFSIIYELIDQVKDAMLGLLDPEHREHVVGHARVLQIFKLSRGLVAGCVVTDGRIARNARARVLRDGQPVFDGGFATLRRFKDDVSEVRNGLECGIRLGDFLEYQEGDIIECYELERLEQTL